MFFVVAQAYERLGEVSESSEVGLNDLLSSSPKGFIGLQTSLQNYM